VSILGRNASRTRRAGPSKEPTSAGGATASINLPAPMRPETLASIGGLARYLLAL
jgi:hypothetical protein